MSSKFCRSLLLVNVVWIMTDFSSVRQICKRSIQYCSPMHTNWHLIYSFLSDLFCIRFPVGVTHSFTDLAEDWDRLLSFENMFIGVNGCSLKTNENLEVLRGIPVERQVLEVVVGSKGISGVEGLSRTLYHNTCRLFFPQDLDASANAQLESGTAVQDC
ncbi:hypothetical protein Zm00014a_021287 [Zea mays]|uniref:Uncharacterized protein n=1 Tax=Zea mays TaxID=4577 RepID=A0A3L6G5K2_MAIZE|nr:hypothetical protein Zm00014a_021287 [Zea mays]PWZ43884.1 hypothetical protein Zm00014a_021287 [Zea mays]